jgi:hypothetical protein
MILDHRIAIYVPSTIKGNQPAPAELVAKWVRASKIKLASLFGGFTAYAGQGGWFSTELGLIEENVTIVQAFTDADGLAKVAQVRELAQAIATEMEQEVVSVEVDGQLNFIAPDVITMPAQSALSEVA